MAATGAGVKSRRSPPPRVTRQVLADHVADAIVQFVVESKLAEGDRLPTAARLSEDLTVSPAVVRDALEKLAARGVVERTRSRTWVVRKGAPGVTKSPKAVGTVSRASLADQAASAVLELIVDQKLMEGEPLPCTRELAAHFDVSVLVMREALADLSARGVLHRRQGREPVVALPSHELISSILKFRAYLEGIEMAEFQSCRAGLEVRAAALAAARGSEREKRDRLRPLVAGMRAARGEDEFNEYDLAFHLAIADLAGNRALEMLLASLNELVRSSLSATYRRIRSRPGGLEAAFEIHERVASSIIKGAERAATRAMEQHFSFVLEHL